jgi:hypothetical protein
MRQNIPPQASCPFRWNVEFFLYFCYKHQLILAIIDS